MATASSQQVTLFVVDDDEVDVMLVERAFEAARIGNPIVKARDGVEALAMLEKGEVPAPLIILLDINMPRMNGIEFLDELRARPVLKRHLVFMLTTSDADRDKMAAYDRQVAGYLVKDRVGEDFTHLIDMLRHYWRIVEFPPH